MRSLIQHIRLENSTLTSSMLYLAIQEKFNIKFEWYGYTENGDPAWNLTFPDEHITWMRLKGIL